MAKLKDNTLTSDSYGDSHPKRRAWAEPDIFGGGGQIMKRRQWSACGEKICGSFTSWLGTFDCKCFINCRPQYLQPPEWVLQGTSAIGGSISLLCWCQSLPSLSDNTISSKYIRLNICSTREPLDTSTESSPSFVIDGYEAIAVSPLPVNGTVPAIQNKIPREI